MPRADKCERRIFQSDDSVYKTHSFFNFGMSIGCSDYKCVWLYALAISSFRLSIVQYVQFNSDCKKHLLLFVRLVLIVLLAVNSANYRLIKLAHIFAPLPFPVSLYKPRRKDLSTIKDFLCLFYLRHHRHNQYELLQIQVLFYD